MVCFVAAVAAAAAAVVTVTASASDTGVAGPVNYIIEHSFDGSTFAKRCVVRVNVRECVCGSTRT